MISSEYAAYLDGLDRLAREASAAEEQFRKEAAKRAEQLKNERVFAFRRLNLLRAIGRAVAAAKDEGEAQRSGRDALFREVLWSGVTPPQQEAAERFTPVILAVWAATGPNRESEDGASVADAMAEFESWFEENRNTAFLNLMEREVVELPLVEV